MPSTRAVLLWPDSVHCLPLLCQLPVKVHILVCIDGLLVIPRDPIRAIRLIPWDRVAVVKLVEFKPTG